MSIFGPENTRVYQVDFGTGQISDYMTSEDEAECDTTNGDCFLKLEDAETKAMEILAGNGGGLLDMTKYIDEENVIPLEPLNKHLKLKTAQFLADYLEEEGSFDFVLVNIDLGDDERTSVEAFVEWLDNDDGDGPKLTKTNLCKVYKTEFLSYVEDYGE